MSNNTEAASCTILSGSFPGWSELVLRKSLVKWSPKEISAALTLSPELHLQENTPAVLGCEGAGEIEAVGGGKR